MPSVILYATIAITLALIFYTIGVWSERRAGRLKLWHLVLFYMGLVSDVIGTSLMKEYAGHIALNFHSIVGIAALWLMFFHTVWATKVLISRNEKAITNFHRFSLQVWNLWAIAYFSGVLTEYI